MINILLVEEERLFSQGIQALLSTEKDMKVVGMISDKQAAINMLESNDVHVVLINLTRQSIEGLGLTLHIKAHDPNIKIIHYMSTVEDEKVIHSISVGANAILLETADPQYFIQLIRDVHKGHSVFSGEVAKVLADKVADFKFDAKITLNRKLQNANISVTLRELDVLYYLLKDMSNSCISKKLQLTEGTVKNYVSNLYKKTKINDRKALIEYVKNLQ